MAPVLREADAENLLWLAAEKETVRLVIDGESQQARHSRDSGLARHFHRLLSHINYMGATAATRNDNGTILPELKPFWADIAR